MYCINCGHELQENANFCAFCGRKIVAFPVKTDKIKNKRCLYYHQRMSSKEQQRIRNGHSILH